jgi:hypothetical protein
MRGPAIALRANIWMFVVARSPYLHRPVRLDPRERTGP